MWWSRFSFTALAAVVAIVLSGCGFHPLYGKKDDGSVRSDFGQVAIGPIDDREGQMLKNELSTLMHPRGIASRQPYRLDISLTESKSGVAVSKNKFSTRSNYSIQASYQMVRVADGAPLFSDSVSLTGSYNVLSSEYGTQIAEKDVKARLIRELAKSIANRVALRLLYPSAQGSAQTP